MKNVKTTCVVLASAVMLCNTGCKHALQTDETTDSVPDTVTESEAEESDAAGSGEQETGSSDQTAVEDKILHYSVSYSEGLLNSITQYDPQGNKEIKWRDWSDGLNIVNVYYDTSLAEDDYYTIYLYSTIDSFEQQDLKFLLDEPVNDSLDYLPKADTYEPIERYYSYDQDGNITYRKLVFEYEDHKTTSSEEFDSKGRKVNGYNLFQSSDGEEKTYIYQCKYDDHNVMTYYKSIEYDNGDLIKTLEEFYENTYDLNGNLIDQKLDTAPNGTREEFSHTVFEYDDENRKIRETIYDIVNDTEVCTNDKKYTYDENGECVFERYDDYGRALYTEVTHEYAYEDSGYKKTCKSSMVVYETSANIEPAGRYETVDEYYYYK